MFSLNFILPGFENLCLLSRKNTFFLNEKKKVYASGRWSKKWMNKFQTGLSHVRTKRGKKLEFFFYFLVSFILVGWVVVVERNVMWCVDGGLYKSMTAVTLPRLMLGSLFLWNHDWLLTLVVTFTSSGLTVPQTKDNQRLSFFFFFFSYFLLFFSSFLAFFSSSFSSFLPHFSPFSSSFSLFLTHFYIFFSSFFSLCFILLIIFSA